MLVGLGLKVLAQIPDLLPAQVLVQSDEEVGDSEIAVVPPAVQDMMIEYDRKVRHYEIVD